MLNSSCGVGSPLYDEGMSPTILVLASVGLGVAVGALVTATILAARSAGRRRARMMSPELPEAAVTILHEIDTFAVILDASLSPVYVNPAARDERQVSGEELREPEFLRRARQVMSTGIADTREPDPEDPSNTVRVHIIKLAQRFLVVLAEDLGEEQRVNAMRRDFIANVSHELKTPIAAIGLLAEAVKEAADQPTTVRKFANSLMKESRRLGDLSRDIIHLSEAQSTLKPEDRERVDLRELVRTEVEAHRGYATASSVDLVVTEPRSPEREPVIQGKPSSLSVAVANLLSNAIQHSPDGGRVGVGMEVTRKQMVVTITDQGAGIPPEHLPRIFERFYRLDESRSREGGGTGLGLSIARHTMRAHGGDVDVWSQPGVGSSFTLTFPLLDEDPQRAKKRAKKKIKKAVEPAEPTRSSV